MVGIRASVLPVRGVVVSGVMGPLVVQSVKLLPLVLSNPLRARPDHQRKGVTGDESGGFADLLLSRFVVKIVAKGSDVVDLPNCA